MSIWLTKSLVGEQLVPLLLLHISSFGVIPKKGQPGPGGSSVNDGIDPEQFSLQYIHVDDIIRMFLCCCFLKYKVVCVVRMLVSVYV